MNSIKKNISLSILLFINFIFIYNYASRITDLHLYVALLVIIIQYAVYKYHNRLKIERKTLKHISIAGVFLIFCVSIITHFKVPLESLNVDRWSVIDSFLTEFFNGNYPYYAKSNVGNPPGPMPVYFIIAIPFYLIGELSFLSIVGYGLLIIFLLRNSNKLSLFLLLYILSCSYMYWEIISRSNILTFSFFVVLALTAFINVENKPKKNFFLTAILIGLLLSTRSIYAIAYIVFFMSTIINKSLKFNKLFLFLSIAVASFIFSFLPFIVCFPDDFFVMNPFIVQTSFLVPSYFTIIFLAMAFLLSFLVKNDDDKFFYSGIGLFLAICTYAGYHYFSHNHKLHELTQNIDISYFIFCVPFLIYFLNSTSIKQLKQP